MTFRYLAFSGYVNFGETETLAESLRRFFRTGTNDMEGLPEPSHYLLDHGLEGNDYDRMMLALRRAGHRLEISVMDHTTARTRLTLDHCFTPSCALQQAVCDVADGVSLDEARAKLAVDIRTWKSTIGHEVNNAAALELARHVSKDVGRQFASALMPLPGYFETGEGKAAKTLAMMETKAVGILEDAHRRMMGPWSGYGAGSAAQPRLI
ncbi:hypothetical protein OIU34_23890 [Pararhizobium sp. BT-229]|uniref:hypothetical protein n=1 Tax=Pararhizobium sp. BT-229 TaxID=2986923 RepID=UPI0021F6ABEE|nr:hypothetical protein [Pararhizobium sp. BT-229]MCV9964940.1 hypothetical protein [Pararhizobium sp. BT-229]